MTRIFLLYCLSGFVSLGYQVAWLRIYVDRFGSTDLTFVLVLCNFIAGLGVGALASRALTARLDRWPALRHPLRQYGLIELWLCASALLLTLAVAIVPPDLLGSFPYELRGGVFEPTSLYQLAKIAIATLSIFVPCFFMGVTFPLLCDAFRGDARFPSALYAWNTLGACVGVLACEFALVPRLGHDRLFLLLVGANALLGAYFLLAGPRIAAGQAREAPGVGPDPTSGAGPRGPQSSRMTSFGATLGVLSTCAILSGLLAGSLEADAFKRIQFLGIRTSAAMSFVSFWAVLAIFLGSAAVRVLPGMRLVHIQWAYAAAWVVYVAVSQNLYSVHEWIFGLLAAPETQSTTLPQRLFFPAGLVPLLLYVGIVVFPAFLLISLLLPYVCNRIHSHRRHLGLAYGVNTLAFCAGTIAFTWVAPRVSIFYSLKLAIVLLAIGVALLVSISEVRRLAYWKPLLAAAALAVGCVLTPSEFDRSLMIPRTHPTRDPIRAVRSDSSYTTFVVANDEGDMLYFDNVSLSNASPRQQTYMGLMAHFPLLAQPRPEDVLLICYGVGNTAGAISTHETVQRIDVVELSRNVILTAPEFAKWNQGVHIDPRVRFIHDDGRNFLQLTDRRYDLITSEPPPPLHTGVHRLYSREYYRDALEHLTPSGMMSQWVPVKQLPLEAVDLLIATFVDVFPHALLFSGMREDLILVGGRSPIELRNLERRFGESPRVAGHLAKLGVASPVSLLVRVVQGDTSLRRRYAGLPVIRDARNDLGLLFLDPARPGAVPFDPQGVLEEFRAAGLEAWPRLRAVMTHLGRLQFHAPGFPTSSLTALRKRGESSVALVDVDWNEIQRLELEAEELKRRGRNAQARQVLLQALDRAQEQPKLLWKLADLHLALGSRDAAIDTLRRFSALEPEDARALHRLARLYEARGELALAVDSYRRALEREPALPMASLRLAWILATASDAELRNGSEALRWAQRGLAIHGASRPEVLATLAAAHAELGDFDAAARWQREAVAHAPAHLDGDYRAGLAMYEKGLPFRGDASGRRAYPWEPRDSWRRRPDSNRG